MSAKLFLYQACLLTVVVSGTAQCQTAEDRQTARDFDTFLKPLFARHCIRCHGGQKVNADVNFKTLSTARHLLDQPELIQSVTEAVGAYDMPPDGEPELDDTVRIRLLTVLKTMLRRSTAGQPTERPGIRRLNRWQYNNAVKDLFQLNADVFALPEKLMTRHGTYLQAGVNRMPDQVNASSDALNPRPGFKGVNAFPKDLRASHGFDNQANQLTLSPLLLDAFLKLSVSILDSPDFNEKNVGIWSEFFQAPAPGTDLQQEISRRLRPFLQKAFRSNVDRETIGRYTAYALSKQDQGLSFSDSLKKAASAALSSPMFLYRSVSPDPAQKQFELASRLSFFLWGSSPDLELLQLAERGDLARPDVMNRTVERMFADPKIERFLDTFPAQWMQLENVLAATPDPQNHRLFSLDRNSPASLQMVIEPLLLFDAVFVENRPIVELITPDFAYQSDFLKTWYTSDLKPPAVDIAGVLKQNQINEERRRSLATTIKSTQAELDQLVRPVKDRLLSARKADNSDTAPDDLKPYAAWEFDDSLKDEIGSLDLKAHGQVKFQNGMAILNRSYLLSRKLPVALKAKSLEVWCQVPNLDQRGGGVMGIQGPGDFFDTIVLGERKNRHWISGSNGFSRTEDFPDSKPETMSDQMLHLIMVYAEDGTTTLYRNGVPYGKPYRKGSATFPENQTSVLFGLRHLPPGGNKYLSVSLDRARLYTRALTAAEVASASQGHHLYVSDKELLAAFTGDQKKRYQDLTLILDESEAALKKVPAAQDPQKLKQETRNRFENKIRSLMRSQSFRRVATADPRYGGVITSAAMLSMTSGPKRTHPIARGAWIIEVIFNDPPPPPPNDVPPLNEEQSSEKLTIREKFARHRENPDCAGCHSRLDPLGFALENFDVTGRWRDRYENGRQVDPGGRLLRKYPFDDIVQFKAALVKEDRRFARAFTAHLLRFALSRELTPADTLTIDAIVKQTEQDRFQMKSLIREIVLSDRFQQLN